MIENKVKLRKWDFVTSIVLILFSGWVIFESLKMPLGNEVVNGVQSEWYTSPALMPLIVGGAILIMAISLLITSINAGALETLKKGLVGENVNFKQTYRTFTVYYAIFGFVFFLLANIDYYISIMLFLTYLITLFYIDDEKFWPPLSYSYIFFTLAFFGLNLIGIMKKLNDAFAYSTDIIAIIYIIGVVIYGLRFTKGDKENRKKLGTSISVSVILSIFVCSIFTYVLMVTPPRQGGIIMDSADNFVYGVLRGMGSDSSDDIDLDSIDLDSIDLDSIDIDLLQ